jgi:hypothetical protein
MEIEKTPQKLLINDTHYVARERDFWTGPHKILKKLII